MGLDIKKGVSIVIPCYNDGKYLKEAIESVETCDKNLYELIIVDDGSTDKFTINLFKDLKKRGYSVYRIRHKGVSAARNYGAKISKFQYLLFLDADDKVVSDFLEDGIKVLDKSRDVGVVYGDRNEFEGLNHVFIQNFDISESIFESRLGICAIIRKKVWQDCNGFDENLSLGEDWEFWINAYEKGWKFHYLCKVSYYYRLRKDSTSSLLKNKENQKKIIRYIYKKHNNLFIENLSNMVYIKNNTLLKNSNLKLRDENIRLLSENNILIQRTVSLENELKKILDSTKVPNPDFFNILRILYLRLNSIKFIYNFIKYFIKLFIRKKL